MKKVQNRLTIAALAASVILGGCSKNFITKAPDSSIPTAEALLLPSDLQTALIGTYAELAGTAYYGRDLPVIGDLMADNTYVETKNSNRYLPQYKYTVLVTDQVPVDVWTDGYRTILRANNIIDAKVTGSGVNEIKAQAYALRAWSYFRMVTYFSKNYTTDSSSFGLPIVLHAAPFDLPTRNSVGSVYTQIVSDLKAAVAIAPPFSSSVYLSKDAINGMLAKVYLYMGDYKDAENTANDVINNGEFSLVSATKFADLMQDPAAKSDPVEIMFEVNEDVINNNGFDDLGGIYIHGYADIYCSPQLYNLYSATDARAELLIPNSTTKGGAPGAIVVNKYPNAGSADRDNPKVLRLGEVYLVGAEAAAKNADEPRALELLNTLMTNRDPAFAGYSSTGQQLINDIVQERRKELAFEGDRFFDLNRLALAINRGTNPGSISGPATIAAGDNKRVAPLPNSEIQANPNIAAQQNPGY